MVSLEKNVSLTPYNTFHLPAYARLFARVSTLDELRELLKNPEITGLEIMVLGGGSNILLTHDFDGLVIKNEIEGIEILEPARTTDGVQSGGENDERAILKTFSGTNWHKVVLYAVERDLGGIENLSFIPGSVGAAPMQNIGAYGVELKETFMELEAVDLATGEIRIFKKEECNFGYRDSIFKNEAKGKYFILSLTISLSKHPKLRTDYGDVAKVLAERGITEPTIKDVSDVVTFIRKSKLPDPNDVGNAGSFFKNPEVEEKKYLEIAKEFPNAPHYPTASGLVKIPAAWLIEQCGWKGKKVGEAGSHTRQALVLVNYGNATGEEIKQLALDIIASVHEKFGIALTPEVNII